MVCGKEESQDMGVYVNPSNDEFAGWVKDEFFVDKTGLIQLTNAAIGSPKKKRIVVSRPRRFGKTLALDMLTAYYSCACDSRNLFKGLAIANDPSFEDHLNKHNVILLDMQGAYIGARSDGRMDDFSRYISELINAELSELYPDAVRGKEHNLSLSLPAIHAAYNAHFIFLFDEWDVIYREEKFNDKLKKDFTEFLVSLFKNANVSPCVDLVYMTGILPIPKRLTQSGLNNFKQYTMVRPLQFAEYIGFTETEVDVLCREAQMSLQNMKDWYEGYHFDTVGSVYCPASVSAAIDAHEVVSCWEETGAASELLALMNSVDPKFLDAVRDLLAGVPVDVKVDPKGIDLADFGNLDTALTALVHLGYLSYQDGKVNIPNLEVTAEFLNTLAQAENSPAYKIMARSKEIMDKTLLEDAKGVADLLQQNHDIYASVYTYNQENDLACVVITSYKGFIDEDYTFHREFHEGKGFADIVYLPRPGRPKTLTPIIIELKWDKTVDTALKQIKERRYDGLAHGYPSALLVGISYEKDSENPEYKNHTCEIERISNP